MWNKIKEFFCLIHTESLNEKQKKRSQKLMIFSAIIVELVMMYLGITDFNRFSHEYNFWIVAYILYYLIAIIIIIFTKNVCLGSILYEIAFLYGFTRVFYLARFDIFASLWMFAVPGIAMYIMTFAVAFWSSVIYGIAVTFLILYGPTREVLLSRYAEIYLTRYLICYFFSFVINTIAMYQLHVMRINQNRYKERLEKAVKAEHEKVSSITMETIIAINNVVQSKDLYTGQHSQRVAYFSCLIAKELGWDEDKIKQLRTIALLHDIGKIGVDEDILNKPSRLTDDEYSEMKNHTVMGGNILKDLTLIPNVDLGAKYHHERFDGRGYPEGIIGSEIPLEARIICVADTFDAMSFSRVYRKRCELDYIKSEFEKGRGTQFDPEILDAFIKICDRNDWFRDEEKVNRELL